MLPVTSLSSSFRPLACYLIGLLEDISAPVDRCENSAFWGLFCHTVALRVGDGRKESLKRGK